MALLKPQSIFVREKQIGKGYPTYIIAEIGNNHNGSLELAKKSVLAAHWAGADAVKFQKRFLSEVFTQEMLQKPQSNSRSLGETYGEYRKSLELSEEELVEVKNLAHSLGMAFFATPFDLKSVELLEKIGMDAWKIASFDVTHLALLKAVAKKKQPIFLSTGMSTLDECAIAMGAILSENQKLAVLHCVSVYPTPDEDLNLGAISTLIEKCGPVPVGYSGHEKGFIPTIVAVALGACVVERHFTIDKSLPGPDHATVSLNPIEFYQMVQEIHRIEKAVADKKIYIHDGEKKHREKHGKVIVAKVPIPAGTAISEDMLAFKSAGKSGFSPLEVSKIIGIKTLNAIFPDSVITKDLFE